MAVTPTYPGVYVQEVPSGVRTIAGVSTSIAVFIGRTKLGSMETPTLCLNYGDFERTFSSEDAGSDLPRAVRLFFQNGGSQCYVVRIAHAYTYSEVTLKGESGLQVLKVTAKSAGALGDRIRLAVTYAGSFPESTFNLEVFRWGTNPKGEIIKLDRKEYTALSMDPRSPHYAVALVNEDSALIELEDLTGSPSGSGYSQSGRPVPAGTTVDEFCEEWESLIGTKVDVDTNQFRIDVDGSGLTDVNLGSIDVTSECSQASNVDEAGEALAAAIKDLINPGLVSGSTVNVTFVNGPAGPSDGATHLLRIASPNGDVRIFPAVSEDPTKDIDLAVPLMLGTAQGGVELSRYASHRPAPTGLVYKLNKLNDFAELAQNSFDILKIQQTEIALDGELQTVGADAKMYEDGDGRYNGVREKWSILATKVNEKRETETSFRWSGEVWGSRLALIPTAGNDNLIGTVKTSTSAGGGVDIGPDGLDCVLNNVRYYSLGPDGLGDYQVPASAPANDGTAPTPKEYRDAYQIIDREVDLFNLLVLPQDRNHDQATTASLWSPASVFCQKRRALLLMDAPNWQKLKDATNGVAALRVGLVKDHSAIFYPRVTIRENGRQVQVGPSGAIAGLMSRIDTSRGVWKAPAGTEADLRGVVGLERRLSDEENGILNPRGINTLRVFPNGIVNWGARTMDGDNDFSSEWKYIPIRRLALYLEESLYRGLKWVVFEPNDEDLWGQIRINVGAFMHDLFTKGAFEGQKRSEAYFVKCDGETTTPNDRNLGIVNIWVGFAPLKPAEFVILHLQQIAGQVQV